mgnify:CR=1 FL=1
MAKATKATPKKSQRTSTAATRRRDWQTIFINTLRENGNIRASCEKAKVNRATAYRERRSNKAFDELWDAALEDAGDTLEAEAWRRAVKGVQKPVFGSGGTGVGTVEVGAVQEYSDTLLIFLLKGAKPEKYKDRGEISGPGGGPIPFKEIIAELKPEPQPAAGGA